MLAFALVPSDWEEKNWVGVDGVGKRSSFPAGLHACVNACDWYERQLTAVSPFVTPTID